MVPVLLGMTSGEDIDWQSSSLVSFVTSQSIASAITYPLFLASYQVRHHTWTGFSGLLPSGTSACASQHVVVIVCVCVCVRASARGYTSCALLDD
jgi:hypothetical protein